jgi:hypothetical protein
VTRRTCLLIAFLLTVAHPAAAVETQLWITDSPSDYARSEARGVVVGPDGVLATGPETRSSGVDSLDVVWALARLADGSVALAGDGGRILRWTASGGVRPWVRLPVGQVLCLARDGDGLVAGTGPGGLVYHVGARGDTSLMARTGERYVWGLAPSGAKGRGGWIAATGTRGRLMRIQNGRVTIVLDTDESNLVSIVGDASGRVFAGGDSKGRVFVLEPDGTARTVFDASEDEIRSLAIASDGALYAAGLSASAVTGGDSDDKSDDSTPGPVPVTTPITGGRAVVYRIVPDSSVAAVWTSAHPLVFALAALPSAADRQSGAPGIVAATGNRAAVFALGRAPGASQWLAMPQGQVTALLADGAGGLYAATSNPAALWHLGPRRAARGEIDGPLLDARRIARFGRVAWYGESPNGSVRIETRSGNTDAPDTTWSRWAEPGARSRSASPPARYLQWRLTLTGDRTRVNAVEVAWKEQNLPPRIDDLSVAPQGAGFREGELQPRVEPVTQTLPSGQKVEFSISTGTQRAIRSLPAFARGLRTLQWKSSDPNGDALTYKVDVRREQDGAAWISIGEDLDASSFTWDTNALPDGRYRVRVTADDGGANPIGEGLQGEALSEPFTIDNSPPSIEAFEATPEPGAVVVSGRVSDALSLLSRIEVSLDDGDWRTVSPDGGLADDRVLGFRARLPDVEAGAHTVAVRAVDLAGNTATRAMPVTVPAKR